jgi:hypothetical protein
VPTSCNTPPANACVDSNTLKVYSTNGTCSNGACSYSSTNQSCQFGCADGSCNQDPCTAVTCNTPPANSCQDANTLTVYSSAGSCSNGTCNYSSTRQTCQFGCANGQCNATCVPENNTVFCQAMGVSLGGASGPDNCGQHRVVFCGCYDANHCDASIHYYCASGRLFPGNSPYETCDCTGPTSMRIIIGGAVLTSPCATCESSLAPICFK